MVVGVEYLLALQLLGEERTAHAVASHKQQTEN